MFRSLLIGSCLIAVCCGQRQSVVDDKDAKILKEQRFNAGDGRTGSAFATENNLVFREESDADGNRIGQYSYVGEDGKTYNVKYSAGKDGFRILSGDHVPLGATGQNVAAASNNNNDEDYPDSEAFPAAPQSDYQVDEYDNNNNNNEAPAGNPFINPHDPTHRNFQFNTNAAKFEPTPPAVGIPLNGASLVPNCADCAGVNPFVNPFDASHQLDNRAGLLAGLGAGRRVVAVPRPRQPAAIAAVPAQRFFPTTTTTTPSPRRFFPPGQLKVDRFETGFNFDFQS